MQCRVLAQLQNLGKESELTIITLRPRFHLGLGIEGDSALASETRHEDSLSLDKVRLRVEELTLHGVCMTSCISSITKRFFFINQHRTRSEVPRGTERKVECDRMWTSPIFTGSFDAIGTGNAGCQIMKRKRKHNKCKRDRQNENAPQLRSSNNH